jgi:hypothetical protein
MRIAIDFDDTIKNTDTGKPMRAAVATLQGFKDKGHEILIFTAENDYKRNSIKKFLDNHEIPYDDLQCGKPYYDIFIDDHSSKFEGWEKDYLAIAKDKKPDKFGKDLKDLSILSNLVGK